MISSLLLRAEIRLREPHTVQLLFAQHDADRVDAVVARLSTHFAVAGYAHDRARPRVRADLSDCIANAGAVDAVLRAVSPDLFGHVDQEEEEDEDEEDDASADVSSGGEWLARLAQRLVHRASGSDEDALYFRRNRTARAALRSAFERRLAEVRRSVAASGGVEVLLRAETRVDSEFVAALNRAVQRASAGRCAVQLVPAWRDWAPELADSVFLRLALSAELAMVELPPRPGAQLAVSAILTLEPAAAALGYDPVSVAVCAQPLSAPAAAAADAAAADDVARDRRKAKKAKKAAAAAAADEQKSRCALQ